MTRLSDFAAVESGSGFPIADQGVSGSELPFLKVSDMNLPGNEIEIRCWNNSVSDAVRRRLRAKAFQAGTVIFPKIGAAIATNKKRLLTRSCSIDNNCMGVTGDPTRVDPWFLYYLFRAKNLSDFASDSNPPSIRKTEVEAWDVPLPSLNEQRRVADVLSRAENIVRMRREAEQKAKEIIPALFLDMFGDPATNPKGWCVRRLDEIADVRDGTHETPQYVPAGIPFITSKHLRGTSIDFVSAEHISAEDHADYSRRSAVDDGDVLFGMIGTIGKATMVHKQQEFSIKNVALIKPRTAVSEYLWAYLGLDGTVNRLLNTRAKGGNQKFVSLGILRSELVPDPPSELQHRFKEHVDQAIALEARQSEALAQVGAAFQSLLAGVFGEGEK